jgi:hypothetical protein
MKCSFEYECIYLWTSEGFKVRRCGEMCVVVSLLG